MGTYDLLAWNPFEDRPMRAMMNRMWRDFPGFAMEKELLEKGFEPLALDVYEKDGMLCVKAAMPGMDMKDVKITVDKDVLTIVGERKEEKERDEGDYHLKELSSGMVRRSLRLPAGVVADKAEARFEQGMLTVEMPYVKAAEPKPIEVKVNGHH